MNESPIPAYRVLIAEHNAQSKIHLSDKEVGDLLSAAKKSVADRFGEIADARELEMKINDAMLGEFFRWCRTKKIRRTALCLSGGGIRSGTFALGLLQGLARHRLLKQFDFLSTVSGGGYIGSWLTAWIHRHPQGLAGVSDELANKNPQAKVDPDPAPLRYLRQYSSFITPKAGLFTVDSWTFIGIYFRNLLLNWFVFIPLLLSALIIPRLLVAMTLAQPEQNDSTPPVFALSAGVFIYGRHLFLIAGFILGVWALAYIIFNRPGVRAQLLQRSKFWNDASNKQTDQTTEHIYQRRFLLFCLVPMIISAACLTTYWAWSAELNHVKPWWVFVAFGLAFTFLSWLIASIVLRRVFHPREIFSTEVVAELISLLVAGVTGGIIFWIFSCQKLGDPVIGYGPIDASGHTFAWDVWTGWAAWHTEIYVCVGLPIFLLAYLGAATLFVGISSKIRLIEDEDREWWSRLGAWLLIALIAWFVTNALVIFGPILLLNSPKLVSSIGGISGLIAVLVGRSSKSKGAGKPPNEEDNKSIAAGMLARLLPVAAAVFVSVIVALLSLATTGILQGLSLAVNKTSGLVGFKEYLNNVTEIPHEATGFEKFIGYIFADIHVADRFEAAKIVHMNVLHHTSFWFDLGLGVGLFVFGMMVARAINLNLFSLHAGYRNRLIRGFLAASRPNDERDPNPFTGFDPADNLHMHELRPSLFTEGDFRDPVALAKRLRDTSDPLAAYLMREGMLPRISALASVDSPSPRLIAALRKDLNSVLQQNDFAAKAQRLIGAAQDQPETQSGDRVVRNREFLSIRYAGLLQPIEQSADQNLQQQESPEAAVAESKLFHVVNTTLNLVGGDNLAWQQRKAEPFSISPLHSGCFRLGYRDSRDYGGRDTYGISLGTAAAVSGAAASSNMGYYTTSPLISLLLTFFNVRLGWWLGNPGPAGEETYQLRAPKYSIAPILYEALGLTNDRNKYVYLTDGGHFENLALYEMVLRRCHIIVVSDGAQDGDYRFSDLGNAVRKIRIDLGIPIEFHSVPIGLSSTGKDGKPNTYWALARIRYSCIDGNDAEDGILLYIKPAVYGGEPRDVLEYRKNYPAFPHQSTGDQFFDEPQFESYRILGSFIMDQLLGEDWKGLTIDKMIGRAQKKLLEIKRLDENDAFNKWLTDDITK